MTFGDALFVLDVVFYPMVIVIGAVTMIVNLKRGKVYMAKRAALTLPLIMAYWSWSRTWIPYAIRFPSYAIIFVIITASVLAYMATLPKLYPQRPEGQ
ncbi:hypothetical protein [Thermococcus sp.]|uniref:hypothetical protein n=1 Tax=Thermococcus sp. TaxID=35749 RepID=UPI0026286AA3|nr:hypothetical protein [Thermococcus sp.]